MDKPLLVIAAVLALGLIYVVFPVVMAAFMGYRKSRQVNCPEERKTATLNIDVKAAAWSAALGKNQLQISGCSLWPEKSGCKQTCLAQVS
jgi:hypothetical protein